MDNGSEFDVIIVGGGMVGAAQVLAFCQQHKRVLLLEKNLPKSEWLEKPPLRVSAVNLCSEEYLNELGLWQHLSAEHMCVFNHLSTWEKEASALAKQKLTFSAQDINKSHLGYLIRNEALQMAAFEQFKQLSNPPVISSAELVAIDQDGLTTEQDKVIVRLQEKDVQTQLKSHLVIGADGANSRVRQLLNIGLSGWDYQQHCFSITIKTNFPMQDITWQEFQPSGPKAFLPLSDGMASLIWYDSADIIKQLKQMSPLALKQKVLDVFPPLAGDFEVVQHASFPLTRRQAKSYVDGRAVLIGDAAHTINPLAGQGVNLGYKDVAELSQQLDGIDLTDNSSLTKALQKYQTKRKTESLVMSGAMDSFYTLFSNDKTVLKFVRRGLLNVANKLPWAKKQVLMKAVGY
ncbi:MAG: FAD-dependent monooxygenase [Gammaproteobacteria bacterium]|nr:FAD-dependent monooxygenase [Gammaproteobacteria bacterium]